MKLTNLFLSALTALTATAAGSAAMAQTVPHSDVADHPTIALVHGAWGTSAVWRPVEARLRDDGYKVISVNLPGRTGSPASPASLTLDTYRDTVMAAIQGETRPVVLVGHSFGGISISAVAEAAPERIRTLVYVAAFIPQDGQSLLGMAHDDAGSMIGADLRPESEAGLIRVEPVHGVTVFANDGSSEQQAALSKSLVAEPLPPLTMPVRLTAARFGTVDRAYIKTLRDQAVSPAF